MKMVLRSVRLSDRYTSLKRVTLAGLIVGLLSVQGFGLQGFRAFSLPYFPSSIPPYAFLPLPHSPTPPFTDFLPDVVLVAFHDKVSLAEQLEVVRRYQLMVDWRVQSPYFVRLILSQEAKARGADVPSVIEALRKEPSVRVAEPDYVIRMAGDPNDPMYSQQWNLKNTGQNSGTPDADIDAPEAWDLVTGSTQVIVAVLDTGVDYNHPDLSANMLRDGNNNLIGYDFLANDPDPMDEDGHGTHVAGIIGARGNNSTGIAGVCWTIKLMPIRIAGGGGGSLSAAVRGMDFARTNGTHIINSSWGFGSFSTLLLEALERAQNAGILVIAAAGNNGQDNDRFATYPASYNRFVENIIAVAATDRNDQLWSFSNFGARSVDIAAPGVDILSTSPGNTYTTESGTSQAAAHVAGVCALIKARFPTLNAAQIKARLLASADYVPALLGRVFAGRLNAFQAAEIDTTAPGRPTNFLVSHRSLTMLRLAWRASGDDGSTGRASRYDLRYSTSPITVANFNSATPAAYLPQPANSGTSQAYYLTGLEPHTPYYLALRAVDNVGNVSTLATLGPVSTGLQGLLFEDAVEGAPQFIGEGGWSVTNERFFTPSRSYTDSPAGFYNNNQDMRLTMKGTVALTTPAVLMFRARTALLPDGDYLFVEISSDGGTTWNRELALTGEHEWDIYRIALLRYNGGSIKVRFRLITDSDFVSDGVWIDDIRIFQTTTVFSDNAEGSPAFVRDTPWAVSTEQSFSPTHAYTDSPGALYQDDLDISLTQGALASLNLTGSPYLDFKVRTDLEDSYDYLHVEVSSDGGTTWFREASLTGANAWSSYTVPLGRYSGSGVKVRFRLITDSAGGADGVWLDDIFITSEILETMPATALDVSNWVRVTRGSFRYDPATRRYRQVLLLKNISQNPIPAPLSLVLDNLSSNATLANATGTTSAVPPAGSPYMNVNVGSDNLLRPGEGASVVLEFTRSDLEPITYTTRVLAGDGSR